MENRPIRILIVEDLPTDAELAERTLLKEDIVFTSIRVETKEEFLKALVEFNPDIIISDYMLPMFNGMKALKLLKEHNSNIPFVILTGSMNEETAVACIKAGANDYVIKEHIKKLPFAVKEALEQKRIRIEKENAIAELRESEARYHSVFNDSLNGIYRITTKGKFLLANQAFISMLGYSSYEEMASSITDIEKQLFVNPEDRKDLLDILKKHGVAKGFKMEIYRKDGAKIWISSNIQSIFDKTGNCLYYDGVVEDITERKYAQEALLRSAEKLKRTLNGTINALSLTIESRDPYTAGHQKKVADLAERIARDMGFSEDAVENIKMAGIIHDIGKMSIPVEILSKPGKLTNLQMNLIKVHSRSGYDILKNVDLPYPIAEVVFQHHERLDGSGYPQGLKGGEILLESKIIAVADVVEAMASHRPYRPALGIDIALEEIEKNKGILYDEKVVDVCIKLFREKRFAFE